MTHVTVVVRNPADPGPDMGGQFLVDTGPWISGSRKHLKQLGFSPKGKRTYELADGSEVKLDITIGELEFMGDIVGSTLIFGDDDAEPILGRRPWSRSALKWIRGVSASKRLPATRLK